MTTLWNTMLRLQSVHSGLAWKPSSSLLIIHLCSFTATWLYATAPTQALNAQRNVHQMGEEDVKWAITCLMCTLCHKAHSIWHDRDGRNEVRIPWTKVVCKPNFFFIIIFYNSTLLTIQRLQYLLTIWGTYDTSNTLLYSRYTYTPAFTYLYNIKRGGM